MQNISRQKAISNILKKYSAEFEHAQKVKNLALLLFDKTREIFHNLGENERDLLEAGALLHDIGYYVDKKDHHKHSCALIMQEHPEEFTEEEIKIIANIARYHRGKMPRNSHKCFSALDNDKDRELVKKLGAIVRIADGLDRGHVSAIEDLNCFYDSFSNIFYIILESKHFSCQLEMLAIENKKDLFEKVFNVQVKVRLN
ncbi:MAG: HD domain-containing protein [Bacteroidota bacterium]|nr:HD domain-containing protein [Bacteroidota bacterium]